MNDNFKRNGSLYVVIEGIDGVGKTTLVKRLVDEYAACSNLLKCRDDFRVTGVAEPYLEYTRHCMLQKPSNFGLDPTYDAYMFAYDRYVGMRDVIAPTIGNAEIEQTGGHGIHRIIISDRSYISSLAYQMVDGLSPDENMKMQPHNLVIPDGAILLYAHSEDAAGRSKEDPIRLQKIATAYNSVFSSQGDAYQTPTMKCGIQTYDKSLDAICKSVVHAIDNMVVYKLLKLEKSP